MISEATLSSKTSRDLAQMAKKKGVPGWHSMRKMQLIKALIKLAKDKEKKKQAQAASSPLISARTAPRKSGGENIAESPESEIARKIRLQKRRQEKLRDIAFRMRSDRQDGLPIKDRVVLLVRDPYWLQAYWEVTEASVRRVKSAIGKRWHLAKPVLRLIEVAAGPADGARPVVAQQLEIHGGASNWFLNILGDPKHYRVAIGYVVATATGEKFYSIAKSNEVISPMADSGMDESWSDIACDTERYFAMSGGYQSPRGVEELKAVLEEKCDQRLHTVPSESILSLTRFERDFKFEVKAHLIVQGTVEPRADLTIAGAPVDLEPDGTFSVRMEMPEKRELLSITASSRDGMHEQTAVLSVECNNRVLEPVVGELTQL